ncbi:hypothetical protein [Paenibacillus sp. OAE614]|uniref:hypothetical protein n=1 Tax=Paenibacillus sp. OAE614 TaxID=2663804 RepID=UPI001A10235F
MTVLVSISAMVFTILTLIVVLFQLALALGMPWGSYAMGGKFPGKYPPGMRVGAIVQAIVLLAIAAIVLSRSGFIFTTWDSFANKAIWFVVAFSTISTVLNLITRSKWERRIWAPVSVLLLVTSVIVAVG